MINLKNRIKKARKHARLTQPQLAELIGVSHRTLTSYEKDASKVTIKISQKIASECKVNEIWLLTGKGEMLDDNNDNNVTKVIIEHQDIVKHFKDPERAKDINKRLIEIEAANEELYNKVDSYIQGIHDAAKVFSTPKKKYQEIILKKKKTG